MQMKIKEVEEFASMEIVAKTVDSVTGSIDRKTIGRALLTTEVVDKKYTVVGGDDTVVKHVDELLKEAETELFVELVGNVRSLASFKFFGGYKAENTENAGVTDLYTEEGDKIERLVMCAERMCADHNECDGQWKIVDKDGNRWFLRRIVKSLSKNGKID